jgi:hypothetical protein
MGMYISRPERGLYGNFPEFLRVDRFWRCLPPRIQGRQRSKQGIPEVVRPHKPVFYRIEYSWNPPGSSLAKYHISD